MIADLYTLEWRGKRTQPMSMEMIRAALEAGDIHSMYQIQEGGRWRLLRDFLDEHRPAKSPPSSPQFPMSFGTNDSVGEPLPSMIPTTRREAATSVSGEQSAMEPMPRAAAATTFDPRQKFPKWLTATLVALSVVIFLAGTLGVYFLVRNPAKEPTARGKSASTAQATISPSGRDLTTEELMEQRSPFVVQVNAVFDSKEAGSSQLVRSGGSGSGVHIANRGGEAIYVTNRHVIQPPEGVVKFAYSVNFHGKDIPCRVIGIPRHDLDLAKLSIEWPEAEEGEVMPMVPVDQLKAGQECVAIGSPLGEGISITNGIISMFVDFPECKMIRTSAPVSPGNSGGGLFSKKDGSLIGITTLNSSGRLQNMNYAIPVDYILNDLFWKPFEH